MGKDPQTHFKDDCVTRVKIFERARESFDIIRTVSSVCAGIIPWLEKSV